MKVEIKIPKMGESIVEATIGNILKPTGALVKEGEEVLEIETEKVNQVLTAPASGKIEWKVKQGETVKIDQTIGVVDSDAKMSESLKEPKQEPAPQKPIIESKGEKIRKKVDDYVAEVTSPSPALAAPLPPSPPAVPRTSPPSPPAALRTSPPSPPAVPRTSPPSPPAALRTSKRETRKKMSTLRKVIAQRLVQVKNETAMLTTFNEVDMHAVIKMRTENQEIFQKKHAVKLGFMSFFVKAVVSALQKFPDINARIDRDEIVYHHFYDIGIAVGTEKGLFVPVIRDADLLSFAEIEKALKIYAEKAKNGTIGVDEMQGGTFTITNGGTYGSMLSTPILNPPQSGILGMHNIVKRAVVINDEIAIRPIMYLALSYDHRIVDGKEAISFLMHIKNVLEDPARFLLDL